MIGGYQIIDLTGYPFNLHQGIRIYDNKLYKQVQNTDKIPIISIKLLFQDGDTIGVSFLKTVGIVMENSIPGILIDTCIGVLRLLCEDDGSISINYIE